MSKTLALFILPLLFLSGKDAFLKNIKISSKYAYFSLDKKEMNFENNVKLVDEKLTLSCLRLRIIFDEKEKIKKILCYEKIEIKTENSVAQGEILEYFPSTEKLILSKNAKLAYTSNNGEKSYYEAEKITFFKNSDIINVLKPKSTITIDKNAK